MSAEESKIKFIELWRGIAVLVVVAFHLSARIPPPSLGQVNGPILANHFGKLGVYIFFVISGYLIAKSLEESKSLAHFYAKRISRLWPLFIAASIFIYLFLLVLPAPVVLDGRNPFNTQPATWLDLLGSIFFLEDLGFRWVDGVFWSIAVELKFYLYAGLFAAIFKKSYIDVFCSFALALASIDLLMIVFNSGPDLRLSGTHELRWLSQILHGVFISAYLPFFAIGLMLFRGQLDGRFNALCMLSFVIGLIALSEDRQFDVLTNIKFLIALAFLFAADHFVLKDRVLLWLGKYSYSLYLFHQMIGLSVMKQLSGYMDYTSSMFVALALVALISWLFSLMFEWRYRLLVSKGLLALFSILRLDRLSVSSKIRGQTANPVQHDFGSQDELSPRRQTA